jgi:hypothetical protein
MRCVEQFGVRYTGSSKHGEAFRRAQHTIKALRGSVAGVHPEADSSNHGIISVSFIDGQVAITLSGNTNIR